ncbi:MAG: 30S ribosomal protein S1 [Chitinophagales bacterium]
MAENELVNEQAEDQQESTVVTETTDDANAETVEQQTETETNTDNNDEEVVVTADAEVAEPTVETVDSGEEEDEVLSEAAHDEFDWTLGKKAEQNYQDEEYDKLFLMYDVTFKTITEHEIVTGIVEAITESDVVLDVGFKSDGLVPTSEFRDLMPDLKKGDKVEVYVLEKEDERGQLRLSRKNAKLLRAWENIVNAHENDTVVTGTVISKTKGGLIANVFGLETFLPGSQIDVKPIVDYDAYVGMTMEFKVVKINEAIKNAVVSHKALIESDLEDQRQRIISQLEKGQVLEGTVKNITDFGAFIDLGGVDGLLYITDISWGRINHPSEILENGQKLNVVVIDFDDAKKRISLGLKQLTPHPWDVLDGELTEGSVIQGKIVNIEDYGGFLEITPGVEGLIHVSEVSWSNQPVNAREYFKLGETYSAKIVTLDREDRKMSLSIKQLQADPWDSIKDTFPINSKHTGEVKNLTPYGVFVELSEGIGGMVHISDLSWTKRFNHPSEYTRVGEQLDVVILGIDQEARKLSLGHKQIEEDPWDTFETVFPKGSEHTGTIIKRDDKGGIVALPYGLEAFAPNKHLRKEDGSYAQLDETLVFRIREFDRNDKRIIVSHSDSLKAKKDAEFEEEREKQQEERKQTTERVRKVNTQADRTTLGDLSVLSDLKKQMEESEDDN